MAKSQSSPSDGADRQLLAALDGRPCSYCSAGTLERAVYKGNEAVVCDSCDTPQAQLW
ncbi:HVO_A0556 family zinc finger protein [Natronolimnohabitans innermongolicus]|uniref:Small CPxCG-related zinc finger protein n=1 Tax=Natronolimnohabitans innermongolicus JCM 12255 TaxID=1227499 RepID=L9XBT5_9EURY|nr:HVO_A0556 family zinc finger protein [Natronolimnohabitans innermongolicus]ELY58901.1 hypothetical protein C493_05630 [Natronolimnohabitans innermongolicus JCM 12255]